MFYSCLPKKTATFYPNQKSLSGGGFLSYKKSLKVEDDEVKSEKANNQQQKLGISLDVLDSAKALLVERYRMDIDPIGLSDIGYSDTVISLLLTVTLTVLYSQMKFLQ